MLAPSASSALVPFKDPPSDIFYSLPPPTHAAAPPKGTVVVLAPTDAAFGTLLTNAGLTPEAALANQALIADFILYHVGVATSERATSIKNLAGDTIKLSLNLAAAEDGTIVTGPANKPKVTGEPIQCTAENQWMLPMDAVLLPAKYAALAKPAAPTAAPTAKAPAATTAGPTAAPMAKAPAATTTSPAMAPSPASSAQTAVLGAAAALAVFVALA